jgi:hypothetical protein
MVRGDANHIAPFAGTWPVKPVTWCLVLCILLAHNKFYG